MATFKTTNWPSARLYAEAIQFPSVCFSNPVLRATVPAVDRLGMPIVTSGQFAYVYKLKSRTITDRSYAVRCFRSHSADRELRYSTISRHLSSHDIPCLASFSYETEGVLAGDTRYPILFMDWIEGPTLDTYLDETVNRKEVLRHLAAEWIGLVKSLKSAGIAHGDLQHGNIIVEHGKLRLVDMDGLFVPEMSGWAASELGHQHFQHPKRNVQHFNASLDNFSALVIYLSLISLEVSPSLWKEFHDENLLFTREDFQDPANSKLFARIKELGSEHRRLALALEESCHAEPLSAPELADIVDFDSPVRETHAVGPIDLEVKGRTREVLSGPGAPSPDWVGQVRTSPFGTTWQTGLSGLRTAAPAIRPQGFTGISKAGFVNARDLISRGFLWWYWGIYISLKLFGLEVFYSLPLAVMIVGMISIIYGFIKAYNDANNPALLQPSTQPNLASAAPSPVFLSGPPGPAPRPRPAPAPIPPFVVQTGSFVGNRALGIYHLQTCNWAGQISRRNRVLFANAPDAVSSGYRGCKVCQPPAAIARTVP